MLRLILLTTVVLSNLTFAGAISCSDGKPEGVRFTVLTNTKVLDSTKAVYVAKMDVVNEYPELLGLYALTKEPNGLRLNFAEAKEVDWTKVDKKACFTRLGDFVSLYNLKRNNKDVAGDYLGDFLVAQRIKIRPGHEKTCPIPKPFVAPPRPVVCDEIVPDL